MSTNETGRAVRRVLLLAALLLAGTVAPAPAQEVVGSVADLTGDAQLGRGGAWSAVAIGTEVALGDTVRTGRPGRLRIVFRDDSVLAVADDTEVRIDEQVFDPDAGSVSTLLRLLKGKVRSLLSDYYKQYGASYEVETPVAIASVRGTEFVITYDPGAAVSDVVGVNGRTEVHSVLDRVGHGVFVTRMELTRVFRGRYPTPPRKIGDALFRQYLAGTEFVGEGRAESLVVDDPVLAGTQVPQSDRAEEFPPLAPPSGPRDLTSAAPRQAPWVDNEDAYRPTILIDQPPAVLRNGEAVIEF
jgi:hypothetical protein